MKLGLAAANDFVRQLEAQGIGHTMDFSSDGETTISGAYRPMSGLALGLMRLRAPTSSPPPASGTVPAAARDRPMSSALASASTRVARLLAGDLSQALGDPVSQVGVLGA